MDFSKKPHWLRAALTVLTMSEAVSPLAQARSLNLVHSAPDADACMDHKGSAPDCEIVCLGVSSGGYFSADTGWVNDASTATCINPDDYDAVLGFLARDERVYMLTVRRFEVSLLPSLSDIKAACARSWSHPENVLLNRTDEAIEFLARDFVGVPFDGGIQTAAVRRDRTSKKVCAWSRRGCCSRKARAPEPHAICLQNPRSLDLGRFRARARPPSFNVGSGGGRSVFVVAKSSAYSAAAAALSAKALEYGFHWLPYS